MAESFLLAALLSSSRVFLSAPCSFIHSHLHSTSAECVYVWREIKCAESSRYSDDSDQEEEEEDDDDDDDGIKSMNQQQVIKKETTARHEENRRRQNKEKKREKKDNKTINDGWWRRRRSLRDSRPFHCFRSQTKWMMTWGQHTLAMSHAIEWLLSCIYSLIYEPYHRRLWFDSIPCLWEQLPRECHQRYRFEDEEVIPWLPFGCWSLLTDIALQRWSVEFQWIQESHSRKEERERRKWYFKKQTTTRIDLPSQVHPKDSSRKR